MNRHSNDAPMEPGTILHAAARHQLVHASQCLGWKGGRRHKGVHLARKSIRRARSVLALAPSLGPGAEALDYSLREINKGLSCTRDAQALVEAIDRLSSQTRDEKWLKPLPRARRRAVDKRQEVLQEVLAADPGLTQVRNLLIRISAALVDLPWSDVSINVVEAAFSLSRKQARKAAGKASKTGRHEDWHRWRRKARRQSQQQRILTEAHIKSAVRNDDKDTAELLGQQQDCSLLLDVCESDDSPIRWADRIQLEGFVEKKLSQLRKALAKKSVAA